MKSLVRKLFPQWVINYFWHLPNAVLANIQNGFPSRKLKVVGVTGTDGKTTTVNMIYQILKNAGKKVSMVSTINAVIGQKSYDTGFHVTSPDSSDVQKFLKQALESGSEYMVLEVTSHALDQFRFWGVQFDIGVITNITHEHLDYHKTWENYFLAKAKLIKRVKLAVLNKDEKHFSRLSKMASGEVVSFGLSGADFNPENFSLNLNIPGEYNVLNALAAAAVAQNLGVEKSQIQKTLDNFEGLLGRMEEIENDKGFRVIVDFAHTPNALENALNTLRKETRGRVISVFGSAGKRDVEKRALMGEISVKLADISIITAEDPRGEIDEINRQIMEGVQKSNGKIGKDVFIEPDRQKAIEMAISLAKRGDIIGIFGKGHERSLNLDGTKEIAWSDQEAARKVIRGENVESYG